MTPDEINEKISQLKGWNLKEVNEFDTFILVWEGPDSICRYRNAPNWANDIELAMSLAEEAKGWNVLKSTTEPRLKYWCRLWYTEGSAASAWAETTEMSICLAWIAWKEGTK